MPDWPLLQSHPLLCLLGLVLLVGIGLPLPLAPALLAAGAMAAGGRMAAPLVLVLAPLTLLPGDLLWYLLGKRHGERVVRTVCLVSLSRDVCIRKTQLTLERFTARSFLVGRFLPGFAMVAPPIAGASRQPLGPFVVYDGLGTLLYTTLYVALGYLFADQLAQVLAFLGRAGRSVTELAIGALVLYIGYKLAARYWLSWRLGIEPAAAHRIVKGDAKWHFFDLRSERDLQEFPFAIVAAQRRSEAEVLTALAQSSAHTPIILFCYCPNQETSTELARNLRRRGFARAFSLRGGIHAWEKAGLPLMAIPAREAGAARVDVSGLRPDWRPQSADRIPAI